MKRMGLILRALSCIFAGVCVTSPGVLAGTGADLKEVLAHAEHYYNQKIAVQGKAVSILSGEAGASGAYLLRDGDGTEVEVISKMLPVTGKKYTVTLAVEKGESPGITRFVETGRSQSNTWKYVAYVFAGLGAALAAALVFGGSGTTDSGVRQ